MTKYKNLSWSEWWDTYGIFVIVISLIIFLFLLLIIYKLYKHNFKHNKFLDYIFPKYYDHNNNIDNQKNQKIIKESKGEIQCKIVLEKLFNKPFTKVRPDFLFNNITKQNLELDLYNKELNLAVEYNGKQHYEYVPYFHKSKDSFYNQQYRDQIKKNLCEKNNIVLIDVPYTVKIEHIEQFLIDEIDKYPQYKKYIKNN
jgi:hypothetical protein